MALAMSRDLRVIVVKLADRLHNMRTLSALGKESARRIALETMEIYAPIALRLGMQDMCEELENLCFGTLYPMRARRIASAVEQAAGNRRELTETMRAQIEWHLVHKRGFRAQVFGRKKSVYSIYSKMRAKRLSFNEIMDVYGFRIVVDDVDACYRALGAVHGLYRPRPGTFKDYIAIPKANGYQSLHTVLFGMHGVLVEIQIRTPTMEQTAQHGIAAHWAYKTGDDAVSAVAQQQRVLNWVSGLLDLQKRTGGDAAALHRAPEGGPVSGRDLRVHAARRSGGPAGGRHGAGLRLRGAHRHRQPMPRLHRQRPRGGRSPKCSRAGTRCR